MVGTTIAKNQFKYARGAYSKGTFDYKRSFHDKINIVSLGMTTKFKVDSHFFNA